MKKISDWIKLCVNSDYLKDANGQKSLMRLLTIVVAGAILGIWVAINIVSKVHGAVKTGTIDIIDFKPEMVYVLLTAVLGKAVQKFAEKSDDTAASGDAASTDGSVADTKNGDSV